MLNLNENVEVLKYRYLVLTTKLAQCEQYDMWGRWSWEEDKELMEIKKKLQEMGKEF